MARGRQNVIGIILDGRSIAWLFLVATRDFISKANSKDGANDLLKLSCVFLPISHRERSFQ
jgi:hypothetical protein